MSLLNIQGAVNQIKYLIEDAIRNGGSENKNKLIRSQLPIRLLHDAVKTSFIKNKVNPNLIYPKYGAHNEELKLAGFFKYKDQDICIVPNNIGRKKEILDFDGILKGQSDTYGQSFTERILSVNVRSQLSSIAKNFDTLYERSFAEPLNLHLRCHSMVLGDLYMIPVYEYDSDLAKENIVGFKNNSNVSKHIEKYIYSFSAINGRTSIIGEEYKYERVCLLIVDFSKKNPKIYNTDEELRSAGLLPEKSTASINSISFPSFTMDLLHIYQARFGFGRFI